MFCKEQAVQLHRVSDQIRASGAELAIIGNGAAHFIRGFQEETGYTGRLYTDPSLVTYRLAGMKRGFLRTLNPLTLIYGIRSLFRGNMQSRTKGRVDQQG